MPLETFRSAGPFDNETEARTEKHRLDAVRRYDILDTPPDGAFDRITALASLVMRVPVAIVSIVDHDRIWFKSRHGLDVEQIDRDPGLCASCILQEAPWIVNNAKTDPRTLANPLVAGEAGVQFYLGIPLRTPDGFNLGTLCVIDFVPRVASDTRLRSPQQSGRRRDGRARAAPFGPKSRVQLSAGIGAPRAARRAYPRAHAVNSHTAPRICWPSCRPSPGNSAQSQTIDDYVARLAARVQGLAQTHDLIADDDWHGVTLDDLAARQLAPFLRRKGRECAVMARNWCSARWRHRTLASRCMSSRPMRSSMGHCPCLKGTLILLGSTFHLACISCGVSEMGRR